MPDRYNEMNDHDLLVEVATKMDQLIKRQDDHEKRIRFLEKYILPIAIAGLFLIEFILNSLPTSRVGQ